MASDATPKRVTRGANINKNQLGVSFAGIFEPSSNWRR